MILSRALECLASNLSKDELIALNRIIRAVRLCLAVLFISTLIIGGSLFSLAGWSFVPESLFSEQVIYIDGASSNHWHSFQIFFVLTIIVPVLALFYLSSALISVDTAIHDKIQPDSLPLWAEFLIGLLAIAIVVGFGAGFRFLIQ
jgi:hypothetical protein